MTPVAQVTGREFKSLRGEIIFCTHVQYGLYTAFCVLYNCHMIEQILTFLDREFEKTNSKSNSKLTTLCN